MNASIMQIFSSVQGEGKYTGVKQVFVRFFECNMHCSWCDTPGSIGDTTRQYAQMTKDEVLADIHRLWPGCHSVSLTGGEPLVQVEFLKTLLPDLKHAGMRTYLETNGILPEALAGVIENIDIVAMDIKMPSSTDCRPYWREHEEFLKIAAGKDTFIKIVISSATTREDVITAVELVARVAPQTLVILQPNTYELKENVIEKCLLFQDYCLKYLPEVRVIPQMHKFIKVP